MKARFWVFIALALVLAACSAEPPEETVFDDQVQTIERAQRVQDTVDTRAGDIARRLQREDDDDPPR